MDLLIIMINFKDYKVLHHKLACLHKMFDQYQNEW